MGCRACGSSGGGCQFLGTAATCQVVAEALGMALPHSALAPSGEPVWLELARRSALAVLRQQEMGLTLADILTPAAIENALVLHAAFGGSTNLLLHIPAIAHAAGLPRPTVEDWIRANRAAPAPGGCAAQWAARVCHRGGIYGRRRSGSDAAPAPPGPAEPAVYSPPAVRTWAQSWTGGSTASAARLLARPWPRPAWTPTW